MIRILGWSTALLRETRRGASRLGSAHLILAYNDDERCFAACGAPRFAGQVETTPARWRACKRCVAIGRAKHGQLS